ncbi:MAG: AAA family ATPase [Oscillospiraceae bacterium]
MEGYTVDAVMEKILKNIEKVIVGKTEVVEQILICLACGGHALIEDVPGLGKTTLVSALAQSVDCSFRRIQFTPDVLPSDVTGFTLYQLATGEKEFQPGAVMSQIVLADEINRTSPKTQSALLQAMQEGRVTVDGETHQLPKPFLVFATQNPIEMTGTYPLPEAQLDRFFVRISVGYPSKGDEVAVLERNRSGGLPPPLDAVADAAEVLALQERLNGVKCVHSLMSYIVEIARKTREHREVELGVSPRGSIALMRAAMGRALLSGRDYTLPDDVQKMAEPVLAHRIVMRSQAYIQNETPATVLADAIKRTTVPSMK